MTDIDNVSSQQLVARLKKYGFHVPDSETKFATSIELLLNAGPEAAKRICSELEEKKTYCQGGPLANCMEWIELRRKLRAPSEKCL